MARTIGFWKNWASAAGSKGSQTWVLDATMAKASEPGIYIGYRVAAVPLSYLILSNDLNTNKSAVDCLKAVRILDKSNIATGKKMASDPAFNLAAQLLAYKLNLLLGANPNVHPR